MTVQEMARQIVEKKRELYATHCPEFLQRCTDAYWANLEQIYFDCYAGGLRSGFITSIEWNGERVTLEEP